MTFEDELAELDEVEIDGNSITLIGTHNGRPMVIELRWDSEKDRDVESTYRLTGEFGSHSNHRVKIVGHLRSVEWNEARQLARGEFNFRVIETRMER